MAATIIITGSPLIIKMDLMATATMAVEEEEGEVVMATVTAQDLGPLQGPEITTTAARHAGALPPT